MKRRLGSRVGRQPRGRREPLGARDKQRLLRLGVCLVLFLTLFLTRGLDRAAELKQQIGGAIRSNADLGDILAIMTGKVSLPEGTARESVGRLCRELFLPQDKTVSLAPDAEVRDLSVQQEDGTGLVAQLRTVQQGRGQALEGAESQTVLTAAQAVVKADYSGPPLPEGVTMDCYDLHLGRTVTPVTARLTSGFGWRDDPLERKDESTFHYGLDLSAVVGTPVLAFAAGTVDHTGEGESYGRYVQLDHGNGIKSFYAHCSAILVTQGQQVSAGEKIAETGATGNVTGAHLHFELRRNGVYLDPAYYIQLAA